MPEDHIPWERWRRKWKNMKPGKNSKEQSVGQDKMFRRGMRSRLIDWFLLVTVIFMKLYYAKEAWGELFVGPLGVPTLREAGRPSNCSFWSRDSWKHIGFQLSSAWDAGWQPLVSSFCPRQVCSHHPHREISGVSGPVHSETSPQSGFRTGPLPPLNWWSFALKSPLLQPTAGSSSATIYETDSAYRMHQCQGWGKVFLSTWCLERARCSPPFISCLLNCGAAQTLLQQGELPGEVCDGTGGGLLGVQSRALWTWMMVLCCQGRGPLWSANSPCGAFSSWDWMMFPRVWFSLLMVNKQALGTLMSLLMVIFFLPRKAEGVVISAVQLPPKPQSPPPQQEVDLKWVQHLIRTIAWHSVSKYNYRWVMYFTQQQP